MALLAGQCTVDPVTGAAGAIFDVMKARGAAAFGFHPTAFDAGSPIRALVAAQIECFAEGMLDYFKANAVVTSNISGGGLQRYVNSGGSTVDTIGPLVTQQLGGTIT